MKNFYETDAVITAAMSNTAFRIRLSAILELMQNVQTLHTKEMKVDAPTLKKDCNAFWVIKSTAIHIFDTPVWQQRVKVATYPLKPTLLKGERQNRITDQNGNLLVIGKSDWCVLDCDTRKPRKFSSVTAYPFEMEHKSEKVFEGRISLTARDSEKAEYVYTRKIRYSDLDFNHHVNNVKYVDFIVDCFDSDFWEEKIVTDFEISYDKEIAENASVDIYAAKIENELFFYGKNDDCNFFKAKIVYARK